MTLTDDERETMRKELAWLVPLLASMVPAVAGEVVHPRWMAARTVNAVAAVIDRVPRLLDELDACRDEMPVRH